MKARIKLNLLKLSDPRVVRAILFLLMLAVTLLSHGSVSAQDCPGGGTSGCDGG